jgi:hypothetical protein
MREKVLIFDGKDLHEIGAEYFFQHPVIIDLNKKEVFSMYQHTMIFNGAIEQDDESKSKMTRGSDILEQMVLDMNGDREGGKLINFVKTVTL